MRPEVGVPEARDHVHERALARTRKTNEGDAFARPDGEREVVDRVPLRSGVAERTVFEDEFAAAVPELDRALVRLIRLRRAGRRCFRPRHAHLRKARVDVPARLRSGGMSRRSAARKVTKSPIVRSPRLVWYMAKASTTATPDMQITCVSGVPSEETFVISSSILRIVSLMLSGSARVAYS